MTFSQLSHFIKGQGWHSFAVVDFLTVQKALEKHEVLFEKWVSKGFHASMDYLPRMQNDRFRPKNKLPDVKSVIVLTAWYGSDEAKEGGVVARYAQGRDYHKVLKKKLIALSDWLKSQDSTLQTYASVDSGPTVDRVLAEASGLGFFGKNACLIDPSSGSYFFIASLMVNADLQATSKKQMPNCGDCNRCSVACPTGAIKAPGVIDSNLCISYLTIENKGGIPIKLRSKIGNRLFGCDICQEVCPFNKLRAHKQEILIEELKGDYGAGESLDLREVLAIETDEQFLEKFAGTPLMRAKRRGLLRNACVVAGNSGDSSLIPDLQSLVDREKDKMLKEHAQWAIEQLN